MIKTAWAKRAMSEIHHGLFAGLFWKYQADLAAAGQAVTALQCPTPARLPFSGRDSALTLIFRPGGDGRWREVLKYMALIRLMSPINVRCWVRRGLQRPTAKNQHRDACSSGISASSAVRRARWSGRASRQTGSAPVPRQQEAAQVATALGPANFISSARQRRPWDRTAQENQWSAVPLAWEEPEVQLKGPPLSRGVSLRNQLQDIAPAKGKHGQ